MEIGSFDYLKFVFALLFVLGLIAALAVVAKRFGLGHRGPVRRGGGKRLTIVEAMPLDAKRRVLLIRRDAHEHLLLLGNSGEQVIETGIVEESGAPTRTAPVLALEMGAKGGS